jgi:hypothetical protein
LAPGDNFDDGGIYGGVLGLGVQALSERAGVAQAGFKIPGPIPMLFSWLGLTLNRYAVTLLQRAHIAKNVTDSTNATKVEH